MLPPQPYINVHPRLSSVSPQPCTPHPTVPNTCDFSAADPPLSPPRPTIQPQTPPPHPRPRSFPSPPNHPTMARSAATSQQPSTELRPYKTLFQHFLPRYINHPAVSAFLMDDNQPPLPPDASNLASSLSYACMYYPPTSLPRSRSAPYPMPQPFLDFGDFMLCDNVYDGIAVGHLYNHKDEHPLALIREKIMRGSHLSKAPKARKFAADLSMTNLEIIEFAWLADHSLIIACRRLDHVNGIMENQLVLSGDLLFYDVIPRGLAPDVPLLRMTFAEKPAICQFCGTRGIKTCACPSSFKMRAPSASSVPSPYSHSAFPNSQDTDLQLVPPGPLAGRLATWDCYARRIFNVSTAGSFFVNWYKRTPDSSRMKLFMSPENPISYQFVCGTRKQTMALAAMYVKRISLCERACTYDARLYGANPGTQQDEIMFDTTAQGKPVELLLTKNARSGSDFRQVRQAPSANTYYPVLPRSPVVDDLYSASADSSSSGVSLGNIDEPSSNYADVLDDVQHEPIEPGEGPIPAGAVGIRQVDCDRMVPFSSPQMIESSAPFETDSQIVATRNSLYSDILFDDLAPISPQNDVDVIGGEETRAARELPTEKRKPTPPRNRGPRLTLSTTSREIQQYMTVDASNIPTCKQCGSSFPKRGNLARHIQTVHLKLKPFQCRHCPASFGYKNHLKRHQSVHERGNEFKCRSCNRNFKGPAQLARHMQQVHEQKEGAFRAAEESDKSRVSCDICGGKCTRQNSSADYGALVAGPLAHHCYPALMQ
eukprot:GFKZ01010277.1.p1 GENE.GFKZ01010277.1~~GFKZ01010277.1.p1  ORF type:complete len:775 (+),score=51.53 GFKZ01010277.1:23-2326(+)